MRISVSKRLTRGTAMRGKAVWSAEGDSGEEGLGVVGSLALLFHHPPTRSSEEEGEKPGLS
ncbi:hypothetical protein C8K11_102275 [Novosphingobium sp. GV055]|nr:hypothetical protein C8K11_102275 [Novosphingobium sp. GV055]PUB06600.1 hypothetical protein C8K12_102275 [Novosphingobium sp. GV061]PUB22651.1 hypothetical protein C8K14_102275 [Novosphingobium sp. GV079]PUB44676.1 hypothetical protein C8K10_102275 [Novosphingobium sp. GV027]